LDDVSPNSQHKSTIWVMTHQEKVSFVSKPIRAKKSANWAFVSQVRGQAHMGAKDTKDKCVFSQPMRALHMDCALLQIKLNH